MDCRSCRTREHALSASTLSLLLSVVATGGCAGGMMPSGSGGDGGNPATSGADGGTGGSTTVQTTGIGGSSSQPGDGSSGGTSGPSGSGTSGSSGTTAAVSDTGNDAGSTGTTGVPGTTTGDGGSSSSSTTGSSASFDISGWTLVQTNSDRLYQIPPGTVIDAGGFVIIGRDTSQAEFETFFGVSLGSNVTYIDTMDAFPAVNGDETFTLEDTQGTAVDGPTAPVTLGMNYQRVSPDMNASDAGSWTSSASPSTDATPGEAAAGPPGWSGVYISEYGDIDGNGNYVFEFVELHAL